MNPSNQFASRHPFVFALAIGLIALALHWLVFPSVGPRIPFLFFVVAITLASYLAGKRAGLLLVCLGLLNAAWQLPPTNGFAVARIEDQVALAIFLLVGVTLAYVGGHGRSLYRRLQEGEAHLAQTRDDVQQQYRDLLLLHSVNEQLAAQTELAEQLGTILRALIQMHGADKGLVSLYDPGPGETKIAASQGFSQRSVEWLAHLRGPEDEDRAVRVTRRLVVRDARTDSAFERFRSVVDEEGICAVHAVPLLDRAGEVMGTIAVHSTAPGVPTEREKRLADLCARKAALHIERASAEARAAQTDRRFQAVLEASAVPFTIMVPIRDAADAIVDFSLGYMNRAAAAMFGDAAGAFLNKRVEEVVPGAWAEPKLFENYAAVAERNEVREFELRSAIAGFEGWYHVVASPLDGSVAVWFADVSERKRQEMELKLADKRKDEFLATLAHELRNPLAPIRQATELVKRATITDAQRAWCFDVIERQVQHMSLLLEDLVDVSRITRGVLQLRRQVTTIGAIIDAAVETARPLIQSKRHELQLDVESAAAIDVDPLRMSQVVSNLLTNAAKYTNRGGVIRVLARMNDRDLTISVVDNGIGLREEEQHSIFSMFSQVAAAHERSEGGLGIGLALTKGLVELHGGSIEVKSTLGVGSTFSLVIPNVRAGASANEAKETGYLRPAVSRQILLADDNRDAAQSLATLLRSDGHRVEVASDGEVALELFERWSPDVLLLDLGMPRISGYEVASRVRSDPRGAGILIIAITGWGQGTDRARTAAAGFDHHLTKPVVYRELVQLLAARQSRVAMARH